MYIRANEITLTRNSTGTMLTSRRRMYSRMEPLQTFQWLRPRHGPTRLADDQRDRHRPVALRHVAAGDQREQRLGRHLPQLDQRVADGGEGRRGVAGCRDVVEADQRDVFGYTDTNLVAASDDADCRAIV